MRIYKILVIVGVFCASSFINSSVSDRLKDINVVDYSLGMDRVGLNNNYINVNGELNIIKKIIKPGDVVFDVGANVGEWSTHVFSNVDSILIHSFEPIKFVYDKLKNNLMNKNVVTHNMALSNNTGSKIFYYYPVNSELSGFYDRDILREKFNIRAEKILVDVSTIDLFCNENEISHIDFLKIDTEGEELNVLLGAKSFLEQKRISIVQFEYGGTYLDSKIKLKQVFDLFMGFNYLIFKIIPNGLMRITQWEDELENYAYANYLAVVESK
ncbi:MAG: Methyltransferase FkbM family [candidate division TM6 bacterium GW2011_GWF2_30_66]|nr:MAG: Methyltransferase FkbM family [candidate division TM6 bacterium GW2011_GWF2_30_66]